MHINTFDKAHEIDHILAKDIAEMIAKNPRLNLGLATGSTYLNFYKFCVSHLKKENIQVDQMQTFNLDRYYNQPASAPSSFETFMHTHFFAPLNLSSQQTHFPAYESDADYGNYDTIIDDYGGLDVILLGIGVNAHIAFNEPGTPFSSKTHKVMLSPSTLKINQEHFENSDVPKEAITMGISTILSAKKIILVAKGENKANAIYDMMHSPIHESVPATALRLHDNVQIYVDQAAGSLI